jgi:Uma2 family endonuclease
MGMPNLARRWTREEVLALPDDGNRYELIDCELLVTPSPRALHQRAVWALYDRVHPYVRANRLGRTGLAPSDLDLESGQSVQPDLFVVPLRDGREPIEWSEFGIPLLIAEVLSPSTALSDRTTKRRRYQRSRVGEYWIVDIDARVIERWRPDDGRPEILSEQLEWLPDSTMPPLVVDLAEYFREVWAET